ncbi:hypothetical protein ACQY0O_004159 [Thecaphora frezii]|nr:dad4-outer kinetochore protein-like protein [Thecaphora frezii]
MENPYEERQSILLERVIRNLTLLTEAVRELDTAIAQINQHNQNLTIVSELWQGYHRNAAFNLGTEAAGAASFPGLPASSSPEQLPGPRAL